VNGYYEPFADELLTSWFARRSDGRRDRPAPDPKPVLNRKGEWQHPDIRPTRAWLGAVSEHFGVPQTHLAKTTIARLHPTLPLDFLSWGRSPFRDDYEEYRPSPALHISWCSRCLAEDFAAGRPAHIRHHWVFAAMSFCHLHRWPLEDRCGACSSLNWRYSTPRRGPLRMICAECWRPLERAHHHALSADHAVQNLWDRVIEFETQLLIALRGKTPDQFKFNFTSASQLVNEVRDICHFLTHCQWPCSPFDRWYSPYDIALNDFVCSAPILGQLQPKFRFSTNPFPLTNAYVTKRRCMLAATSAIIDPRPETGKALFGATARSAIETFAMAVNEEALNRILAQSGHWSPTLVQRIKAARTRKWRPAASRDRWLLPKVTTTRR
jgi:hypothetical protein